MSTSYVIDAVRTPRGRGKAGKGALSGIHPQELFATTLKALAARNAFDPRDVSDALVGCVSEVGEQGAELARNAVLATGWPIEVPGVTLNRFCGSGLHPRDIDLWEINEAFAAVVLQAIRRLGIDPERVNVNGGSIALGHPLGATGAMLLGTALDELERTGKATALIAMCIGGGQGIATILERV